MARLEVNAVLSFFSIDEADEELVSGSCPGAIDAAVALARTSLYALNPGDFSYGTPVLWLNADSGFVFSPDGEEDAAPEPSIAPPPGEFA
ncbi:MAG: hypothetical protein ACK2UR_15060, partial [Candidatus Promineifilaceae bacterium]